MTRCVRSGQAAARLGVPVRSLRSWAAQGLVTPAWRTPGGQARWDMDRLERQLLWDLPE